MKRYLRLYMHFLRFSVASAALFRFDFYFRVLMDTMFYATNIALYKVLFLNVPILGGWSEEQALIFVGSFMLVDALQMTFLANGFWDFQTQINKGSFDFLLLRPVSALFMAAFFRISISSATNLLMAGSFLAWTLWSYSAPLSFGEISFFILLLFNGVLLHSLIRILFLVTVFWTHSGTGTTQLFFTTTELMERPDRIYKPWLRFLTYSFLPFALICSVPSEMLFHGLNAQLLSVLFLVTLSFSLITATMWRMGTRAYASASS